MGPHGKTQAGWFSSEQHFSASNNPAFLDIPAIVLSKVTLPRHNGESLYIGIDRGEAPSEQVSGQVLKAARSVELHGGCGLRQHFIGRVTTLGYHLISRTD